MHEHSNICKNDHKIRETNGILYVAASSPGAIRGAVASTPPAVSTSAVGSSWNRPRWRDSVDEGSPSSDGHSMVTGLIRSIDTASCWPATSRTNVLGPHHATRKGQAYGGCSGGRTPPAHTKTRVEVTDAVGVQPEGHWSLGRLARSVLVCRSRRFARSPQLKCVGIDWDTSAPGRRSTRPSKARFV